MMTLAIRILALTIVVAGAAAAATTPKTATAVPSHQSATSAMVPPFCGGDLCVNLAPAK
jgi:hypothetical protein